jgi:serine/threonine protein kinase/Tfp pilus assembly protein PilF
MFEEEIFHQALDRSGPEERAAYVEQACAGNPDLRAAVEGLLRAHVGATGFLEHPLPEALGTVDESARERPGTVIGPYKLLEQIGEGGFGIVFIAEQQQPVRRKVALKVLKPGMDTRQVVARFEAERQALALMHHPHIAQVFDGGETASGRPYFVMELVKGVPITRFCDDRHLPVRERLGLFVSVCQAVQHAHQKGIIHRDLKPSNVLVTLHDDSPVVKVIDFGIAKATTQQLTEKTLYTGFAQMVGTPLYMSPEQAGQSGLDIDARSDIYSLGVLVYELLTGSTPFNKERLKELGLDELRRIIREEEPPKPSTRISTLAQAATTVATQRKSDPKRLSRLFRRELDWIVMKALEKDRNRRYETASAFAADVQRYLADEPVLACPPSAWYRVGKFARRNKAALAMATVVGLAVLILAGGIGWVLHDRAQQQQQRVNQIEKDLLEGEDLLKRKQRPEARAAIQKAQDLMPASGNDAQRGMADALMQDLAMAERLEAIRLEHAATQHITFNERSNEKYATAFRDYDLDVDRYRPEEAAERIRSRPIRDELRAALDDWAAVRLGLLRSREPRWKGVRWQHLLAVARAADDDETRNRVRDVLAGNDPQALRNLAASLADSGDRVSPLPAELAVFFTGELGEAGAADAGSALLLRAWERNTGDFWLNYELALYLHGTGQPAKAVRFFTAALGLRPNTAEVYLHLGSALCDAGDHEAGIAALGKALALAPDFAGAHNNLGNYLAKKGDLLGALFHHRKAVELEPKNPAAHINLALTLADLANLDAAVACVSPPSLRLAGAVFALARKEAAVASLTKAIEIQPGSAFAHYNRGNLRRGLGQFDKAIADYRVAIKGDPAFVLAYLRLGDALREQGKLPEAEDVCRQAVAAYARLVERRFVARGYHARSRRIRPAEPVYSLGRVLNKQKKFPEAEAAFRQAVAACEQAAGFPAIEILKDLGDSYHALGKVLFQRGKYADAETAFREAIAACRKASVTPASDHQARHMRHDLGRAFDSLSRALAKQGKDEEDALRQAVRYLPENEAAEVYHHLGTVLVRRQRFPEAEAAFRKAIALDERRADPHHGLGLALGSQGKSQEAARHFQAALAIDPDHALAAVSLGIALQQAGQFDEALAWLKKGYQRLPPDHPGRVQAAAYVRNCTNLVALAERMPAVEKGEYKFESAAERVNLARVFSLKKRYETAARLYKEGLAEEPELADDWQRGLRFGAACTAARAGGGWRKQALAWLRADLALGHRLLRDEPRAAAAIAQRMKVWQREPALASVREPAALAKLPADERQAFAELWTEVEVLQLRATKALPAKPSAHGLDDEGGR